jgi:uncharacterized coiled-coil protein SlyX
VLKEFIMAKIEKLNEELTELKSRYEKASDRIKALKEKLKESPFEDSHEEIERGEKYLDDLCDDIEAVENELWFALETV